MKKFPSYAKTCGKPEIDWKAELNKDLTEEGWARLYSLAKSWDTCATGQLPAIIPRYGKSDNGQEGSPRDEILANLGSVRGVCGAVSNKNAKLALYYVGALELRAKYLIEELKESKLKERAKLTEELKSLGVKV